jgi:hypothetical protein
MEVDPKYCDLSQTFDGSYLLISLSFQIQRWWALEPAENVTLQAQRGIRVDIEGRAEEINKVSLLGLIIKNMYIYINMYKYDICIYIYICII